MFQTRTDGSGQGSKEQRPARENIELLGTGCVCLTYWGRNGSGEVQVCNTGMVWWALAATSAPVHSAVTATGLTQTKMKTVGRTWWKKSPPYLIREVCTSYSRPKPKPQLLTDVEKKGGMFPSLLGSSVIFLFTYDHQNAE